MTELSAHLDALARFANQAYRRPLKPGEADELRQLLLPEKKSAAQLDREIAQNAGILGALRDDSTLDSALGDTGLNANMMNGIGGSGDFARNALQIPVIVGRVEHVGNEMRDLLRFEFAKSARGHRW